MILLFLQFIYSTVDPHVHHHQYVRPITRIPLGLTPLPVVITNKKIGTHALTINRQTITHDIGYTLSMEKLNINNLEKQIFETRTGPKDGLVLDYEDKKHLKTLTLYTRYGEIFVGSQKETVGTLPIYLKEVPSSFGRDDIVMFRLIAGNKCMGLKAVSKIDDPKQVFVPVFDECIENAEDQLWSMFLRKIVKDKIDYDRHLLSRRAFEDRQHYAQSHEWPTLRLLINKLHTVGREHLISRH